MKRSLALSVGAIAVIAFAGVSTVPAAPAHAASPINSVCWSVPTTTTEFDGDPGPIFYKRLQCMGSTAGYYGYHGPIDGVMGPNSWRGVSEWLGRHYHSNDLATYQSEAVIKGLQRYAAAHGVYAGPIDGDWGPNSYRGVAWALNREF